MANERSGDLEIVYLNPQINQNYIEVAGEKRPVQIDEQSLEAFSFPYSFNGEGPSETDRALAEDIRSRSPWGKFNGVYFPNSLPTEPGSGEIVYHLVRFSTNADLF